METHNDNNETIKDAILHKITAEEVLMRSKGHFFLKAMALAIVAGVVLLVSISIFNFIFFNLRIGDHGYLLAFGAQGVWLFLKVFPWGLLVIDIALVVFLEWLLRKFRFGYRMPALYLLIALIALAAVIGFAVDRGTPFNDRMLGRADSQRLPPPFNDVYHDLRQPPPPEHGVCDCVVTAINGTTLTAYERSDTSRIVAILVPPSDPILPTLAVGDTIVAAGNFHDGIFHAFGLRQTDAPPFP